MIPPKSFTGRFIWFCEIFCFAFCRNPKNLKCKNSVNISLFWFFGRHSRGSIFQCSVKRETEIELNWTMGQTKSRMKVFRDIYNLQIPNFCYNIKLKSIKSRAAHIRWRIARDLKWNSAYLMVLYTLQLYALTSHKPWNRRFLPVQLVTTCFWNWVINFNNSRMKYNFLSVYRLMLLFIHSPPRWLWVKIRQMPRWLLPKAQMKISTRHSSTTKEY